MSPFLLEEGSPCQGGPRGTDRALLAQQGGQGLDGRTLGHAKGSVPTCSRTTLPGAGPAPCGRCTAVGTSARGQSVGGICTRITHPVYPPWYTPPWYTAPSHTELMHHTTEHRDTTDMHI